jgi:hypothetical protein
MTTSKIEVAHAAQPLNFPETPEGLLEDIRLIRANGAPEILNRLQTMGILPIEKIELEHAFYLIDLCDYFYEFGQEFHEALLLTTIQHAKEQGWNIFYETYVNFKHNHLPAIRDAIRDYLKSIFSHSYLEA